MFSLLLMISMARADVGPPPTCGTGEHDAYCRGHHCIKDGEKFDDNCNVVPDPAATPNAAPTPQTAPATKSDSGCSTAPGGSAGLGLLGLLGLRRRKAA